MKTNVFVRGYNRVEANQIERIERGKLQQLLDRERRIIEDWINSLKTQIRSNRILAGRAGRLWGNIQNHRFVQKIREKINRITDAYPQFLAQVKAAHAKLEKWFFDVLGAAY